MESNNKGITLVEIIISVVLISIVLIFLITLLIQVNNENADNEVKATYLVNQSSFIKQIEEDILDNNGINEAIAQCDINTSTTTDENSLGLPRLYGTATVQKKGIEGNIKCIKLKYNSGIYAYLFLYKRSETSSEEGETNFKTVLSYYKGDFKQTEELEDFSWPDNYSSSSDKFDAKCKELDNYYTCTLPIIGPDYNDYSINLSYAE